MVGLYPIIEFILWTIAPRLPSSRNLRVTTPLLPDGSLDYEDDLLAELDWIVGSLHSSFRLMES